MSEVTKNQQLILDQISNARTSIKTDGYPISIGELISLYNEGEIKLDPAFQRLFRWENRQKTKLIESILIGIPIPEVFVAQKADGTWHVVDGVQRLSTIFQLVGALKSLDELELSSCKYIPALEGKTWKDLPLTTQREFKKSKLKLNIILTQNSDEAQYELFQRLNTGGTSLSDQEVRNCLVLMIKPEFYEEINTLKSYSNFTNCLKLSDVKIKEEYHMELITRMFIGYADLVKYSDYPSLSKVMLNEFIDKETIRLIKNSDVMEFSDKFKRTFDKLSSTLGPQSFLKFDTNESNFYGSFNVSVFEMITTGVSTNLDHILQMGDRELETKIKNIYKEHVVCDNLERGTKALTRFKNLTEFSREYFK